jgi:hypothetical protein
MPQSWLIRSTTHIDRFLETDSFVRFHIIDYDFSFETEQSKPKDLDEILEI